MLVSTFAVLAILLPALASSHGISSPPHLRHKRLAIRQVQEERLDGRALPVRANEAHAAAHRAVKRSVNKRGQQCRPRPSSSSAAATAAATAAPSAASSPSPAASNAAASSSIDNQNAWAQHSSSTTDWSQDSSTSATAVYAAQTSSASNGSGDSGSSSGVTVHLGTLSITDGTCGWCGSSSDQPNGSEEWLNCGVDGSGWTPPFVTKDQLVAADLDATGVFAPCADYIDKFKQYGAEFGIYPILLASFAMQESTCNAGATGGNGEAGLMQIAPVNWESGQNAWDVDWNIRRGAQLFSQMIDSSGGNVIQAIGNYNGWSKGLTVSSATAGQYNGNCRSQNNLDYLFQFVNGWMQNKNANGMGTYFNLASC